MPVIAVQAPTGTRQKTAKADAHDHPCQKSVSSVSDTTCKRVSQVGRFQGYFGKGRPRAQPPKNSVISSNSRNSRIIAIFMGQATVSIRARTLQTIFTPNAVN